MNHHQSLRMRDFIVAVVLGFLPTMRMTTNCEAFISSPTSFHLNSRSYYSGRTGLHVDSSNLGRASSSTDEEWSRSFNISLASTAQTASEYAAYLRNLKEIIASPRPDLNITRSDVSTDVTGQSNMLPNVRIKQIPLIDQNQNNTDDDNPVSDMSVLNDIDDSFVYALCGMDERQQKELDESIFTLDSAHIAQSRNAMDSQTSTVSEFQIPDYTIQDKQVSRHDSIEEILNLNQKGKSSRRQWFNRWNLFNFTAFIDQKTKISDSSDTSSRINYRIQHDMQTIAISIASNIKTTEDWRIFAAEGGGVEHLLEAIQDAAHYATHSLDILPEYDFESKFRSAVASAKILRDLCAISPELASIITGQILDADDKQHQNGESGIIRSMVILLKHSMDIPRRRISSKLFKNFKLHSKLCLELQLYVLQLCLSISKASDDGIKAMRETSELVEIIQSLSSYRKTDMVTKLTSLVHAVKPNESLQSQSQILPVANKLLASLGVNIWRPKRKNQKGIRILCIDGGGTRGVTAVTIIQSLVDALNGVEVCDAFDIIAGTSTGAIIAFLVGLRRESSIQAKQRYDSLIKRIFVRSTLSTPMLLFTTATYDEAPFMQIMQEILGDATMLDSRANPDVPYVFAISSKMSINPTSLTLFRNYNYDGNTLPDNFIISQEEASKSLGLEKDEFDMDQTRNQYNNRLSKRNRSFHRKLKRDDKSSQHFNHTDRFGSRHPGSFRVPQKVALRASTAAPTVFKPLLMGGELYCDGGIVASNPSAVAIHEARTLFPNIPIELIVSLGTGKFVEEKSVPRIGWDGIIGQIVSSATDAESTHHILEDILGSDMLAPTQATNTKYYRFNPIVGKPDSFAIDETDPAILEQLSVITKKYMNEQKQKEQLDEIASIINNSI